MDPAVLALLDDIANGIVDNGGGRIRRERVFRDQNDLLAHDDDWLISRFRLPRAVLLELCAELGPALERRTRRTHAFSVPTQVGLMNTYGSMMSPSDTDVLSIFGHIGVMLLSCHRY